MEIKTAIDILTLEGKTGPPVLNTRGSRQHIRRPYPNAKPTPHQQINRDAFATVDYTWRQLPPNLHSAWNAYQSWRLNFGYNRFQKVNIPRQLKGEPLILDPTLIP